MPQTVQFGQPEVVRPEIRVTTRASKEAIDTQLDLEKMLAAAVFEQARYFSAISGELLIQAVVVFQRRGSLAAAEAFTGDLWQHIERIAAIFAATRVLGRARIRKEVGLPLEKGRAEFAEVLHGIGVEDAVAHLRSLPVITQEDWRHLLRIYRQPAFTAAGVENRAALEALRDLVSKGLDKGWSGQQFEAAAEKLLRKFQTEAGSLRTLWNTTTASAMARGREEMLDDPEVKKVVSYRLYDAILDFHTRPNHRALDGGIAPAEWDGWGVYGPPNGFNCRCTLIGITAARANSMLASGRGFDLTEGIPAGAGPDPGFGKAA